ncbi:hypothetical protein HHK36_009779 [Tetracentron sinense]|uniref:Bet v I/Major latex protein domain-containing protein n=1 Tax=Tetracentron sinense TaxID=13715 RepID=A0A835DLW7_TETSI|nr:hypothetical protein HHK36_009779 [Tetracentron sinense]
MRVAGEKEVPRGCGCKDVLTKGVLISGNPIDLVAKEKIETVDEANKSATFSIFEGDLANFYKNIIIKLYVTPKSEGSSVNWCMDFEKVSKEVPDPNLYQDFVINIFLNICTNVKKNCVLIFR